MFGFLQAAMLLGLAGLALPVIAHLLSKRKYDVVSWGAMQFLELGRKMRRRIRLQELLLLLLRMGLIGLIVFAAARPWARGGLFSSVGRGPGRDVAFVIDGSGSMGWEGGEVTPHGAAVQWVHDYLRTLGPGDTAALFESRDVVRSLIPTGVSDRNLLRERLQELPKPAGASRLPQAIAAALQSLNAGTQLKRDVIVLGDAQAFPWRLENGAEWNRIATLLEESPLRPNVWFVDVAGKNGARPPNFSVDPLQLSRETTVPHFTLRVQTTLRQTGGATTRRRVSFEVDGQRLDDKTLDLTITADGQAAVQFEHQFEAVGSHVVSVVLDHDDLPADDRADGAVVVRQGVPVLLVDGDPQADPVKRETFFARSALTPQAISSSWVRAAVVDSSQFRAQDLTGQVAVMLCNVPQLTKEQVDAVSRFVSAGGGVVIAPGDRVDGAAWNALRRSDGAPLLPLAFQEIASEEPASQLPIGIVSDSLTLPWLTPFRADAPDGGFELTRVRFSKWWKLGSAAESGAPAGATVAGPAERGGDASEELPVVGARLTTGDPWLVEQSFGRGRIVLLAGPLDDAWSTLPGRRALAPFLHELVFSLAGRQSGRNVMSGEPLLADLPSKSRVSEFVFAGPGDVVHTAMAGGDDSRPQIRLADTSVPGIYRLQRSAHPNAGHDDFVVNSDRDEADLAPLGEDQLDLLATEHGVRPVASLDELLTLQADDVPRAELWAALMCLVVALLVGEIVLTRRLVQQGHEAVSHEG